MGNLPPLPLRLSSGHCSGLRKSLKYPGWISLVLKEHGYSVQSSVHFLQGILATIVQGREHPARCGPAASRPPDTFQSKQECGLDLRSVPLFQDNPSLVSMLTTVDRPRWKTGFYPSSHCSVPYLEKVWLVWLGGGARRPSSGISLYLIKISSKMVLMDEARVQEGVEAFPSFWTTQRSIRSPLAPFSV